MCEKKKIMQGREGEKYNVREKRFYLFSRCGENKRI